MTACVAGGYKDFVFGVFFVLVALAIIAVAWGSWYSARRPGE